ncbi:MAG: DUF167 domain-containing protein [Pseudomonadales bacterium]
MQCTIAVKVIPNSSRSEISGWLGEVLKIKVSAQPEKGKANMSVIKVLSEAPNIREEFIVILAGSTSQRKTVEIRGLSHESVRDIISAKYA